MPISTSLRLGTAKLTRQQLADLALEEYRAMRRARDRGDRLAVLLHEDELHKLTKMMED